MNDIPIYNSQVHGFDARGVAKRFRHAAIIGALQSLHAGETMRFVNDHDPLPLLAQGKFEKLFAHFKNLEKAPAMK